MDDNFLRGSILKADTGDTSMRRTATRLVCGPLRPSSKTAELEGGREKDLYCICDIESWVEKKRKFVADFATSLTSLKLENWSAPRDAFRHKRAQVVEIAIGRLLPAQRASCRQVG